MRDEFSWTYVALMQLYPCRDRKYMLCSGRSLVMAVLMNCCHRLIFVANQGAISSE